MTIPSNLDPNQDGFEFAGDPEAEDASGAVLEENDELEDDAPDA